MAGENERYLRWLEGRWEAHKQDHFYNSAEDEQRRTEEVLDILKGIGELSKRSIGSTRTRVGKAESKGLAENKKRYMRWLEGKRDRYESATREEARKEEVLEIFRGLSALARQRFRAY
jgi:hypothetical protein